MPSALKDMLGTLVGLRQLQQMQQQMQMQEQQQRIVALTSFMEQARQLPDPQMLGPLVDTYAQAGIPREALLNVLPHVAPSAEALQGYATRQGMRQSEGLPSEGFSGQPNPLYTETANRVLTGQNAAGLEASRVGAAALQGWAPPADLSAAFQTRTLAGMSQGEFAVDQARANLGPEELIQQAGILGGSRMGAAEDDRSKQGWEGLRQNFIQILDNSAQWKAALGTSQQRAAQGDYKGVGDLMATRTQLLGQLTDSKKSLSKNVIKDYTRIINGINQVLSEGYGIRGLENLPEDPDEILKPGAMDRFLSPPLMNWNQK